jgi:hypothetical protein
MEACFDYCPVVAMKLIIQAHGVDILADKTDVQIQEKQLYQQLFKMTIDSYTEDCIEGPERIETEHLPLFWLRDLFHLTLNEETEPTYRCRHPDMSKLS